MAYGRNFPTVVGFILFRADVLIKPPVGHTPMCSAIFPYLFFSVDAHVSPLFIESDAVRA
jgi:hypothetical protein